MPMSGSSQHSRSRHGGSPSDYFSETSDYNYGLRSSAHSPHSQHAHSQLQSRSSSSSHLNHTPTLASTTSSSMSLSASTSASPSQLPRRVNPLNTSQPAATSPSTSFSSSPLVSTRAGRPFSAASSRHGSDLSPEPSDLNYDQHLK